MDGEGPFTQLYNSSQVAGAIEQQRLLGKIVVRNYVANIHFTAKWISMSGTKGEAVTGRQLWKCGDKVLAA